MTKRALILGGGGVAGIAWETGVIVGLSDAGLDVRNANLFVGTSAGSCVAAQMTSALSLEALYQRQVDPALQASEIAAAIDWPKMMATFGAASQGATNMTEALRRIGALAVSWQTVPESARRNVLASRLPMSAWPARALKIVAVDTASGERRAFASASGVDLIDAAAASCAVPGVWPPVTIGGRRYMDGGVYSNQHADLAAGYDIALIVAPTVPISPPITLDAEVAELKRGGTAVAVIPQDTATDAAIAAVGGNLLDPSIREAVARTGREYGRRLAAELAPLWG
jgi:NTE family protein